jgi:hypothetical protein
MVSINLFHLIYIKNLQIYIEIMNNNFLNLENYLFKDIQLAHQE